MHLRILIIFSLLKMGIQSFAQTPEHYPPPVPQPVEVNLLSIILYVVLPIGIIAAWYFYQRSQKKKFNENKKEDNKDSTAKK